MLKAIEARDADLADELAHAHTRQFQDQFIGFLRENYSSDIALSPQRAAE
jgi:DNA-binding GntR family transcriptional regulator